MPLDHARDVVSEDCEEDDMPPPADNDTRGPIYTFSPGMTPLSFASTSAPIATQGTSPQPSSSLISSPSTSPVTLEESSTAVSMATPPARPHGKRRDPSYIPRPPNAFILFRCAFIKEQNVPGKVEGNHSRLSKIIGLCWKQLAPEEREKWEAKAVVAQAEHRANYPDWRFRPGANAMAKLKVKEGVPATTRRRSVRSRAKEPSATEDGEDDIVASDPKGKGKMKSTHLISLEETRCAKIAGFVAEGIKGEELEVAVKQWEGDHKIPRSGTKTTKSKTRKAQEKDSSSSHSRSHSDAASTSLSFSVPSSASYSPQATLPNHPPNQSTYSSTTIELHSPSSDTRHAQNIPDSPPFFPDVPLTHMFKRSVSAPAHNSHLVHSQSPNSCPSDSSNDEFSPIPAEPSPGEAGSLKPPVLQEAPTRTHNQGRRETISLPMSTISESGSFDSPQHMTWQETETRRRFEDTQGADEWWTQKSAMEEPQFGYDAQTKQNGRIELGLQEMGYESSRDGSQFDRGYLEQYGPFDTHQDAGHPQWRNMPGSDNRQGLTIVLEDPYKDDCCNTVSSNPSPPTLSLPPLSNSGYYYSEISPHTPSSFTSTSFSTLRDWAGEYKHQSSLDLGTWPGNVSTTQSPTSEPWYTNTNTDPWGTHPPQLQHPNMSHDSEDWDRLEYRTSSNLHLPVEPPRQVNFQDELRRLQAARND